jgi:hypothetical protein
MPRAYYSSVLNHPADAVWRLVRDFNNYPRYIEGVTGSVIEDGKRGDEVGAVRRFCYGKSWLRQRLTAHSDSERFFSYAGLGPFEFPTASGAGAPGAIDYAGTVRLTPVVDGDRTFIEWLVDFDCRPSDRAPWNDMLMELIPEWVGSLGRVMSRGG